MLAESIATDRMELPLSSRRAAATAVASDASAAARLAGEQASDCVLGSLYYNPHNEAYTPTPS